MDYVDGTDTGQLLKQHGPLPVGRTVRLVCQMLAALAYAHGLGFVHRDIKPSNLLVAQEGGGEVAKLADFGLARAYQASPLSGLTLTGAVAGTPEFMAPEQVENFKRVRPAADQYAAAAMLYTLLTGRLVYEPRVSAREAFRRILLEEPRLEGADRPEVPDALQRAVRRALAGRPEDRFANAGALRRELLSLTLT
jgi:serine/threonine protein kinase